MSGYLKYQVELYDENDRSIIVKGTFCKGRPASRFAFGGEGDPGDPEELNIDEMFWDDTKIPLTDEERQGYIENGTLDNAVQSYFDGEPNY